MYSLTYKDLLVRNRSFRWLWTGQVISELGNWFNFIAGLGLVRVVSGAAPEAAGILLFTRTAPFALCAPIAGALVDRWSRWKVLFVTDLARAAVALGFLLVKKPEDLWIAYVCSVLLAVLTAFFEAAKNASLPTVTSENGILAGNALMFSTRFLLMSVGAALGGWASAVFGYEAAFVINSVSFIVSAYSIWLIPASDINKSAGLRPADFDKVLNLFEDLREGWRFIRQTPLVLTIIGLNILWAVGGGAINLVADRLGGVVFATTENEADAAVAFLYASAGLGLFIGMLMAREIGNWVERKKLYVPFIGWTLVVHGILYALSGVMPNLWLVGLFMILSRILLGMEFAVQESLLMRSIPEGLRGRVLTSDRAAEISVFSTMALVAGWSLHFISPQLLCVLSGLISGSCGLFWFWRLRNKRKTQLYDFQSKAAVLSD
jgi:MFS family permease